jgi:GT2 family glycosyltransferase
VTPPPDRVTVVIPNWNGERWLPGCLDSIAAQTRPAAQTIIVDNGSRDGSLELLSREYPQVRVIALGHNTGFAQAANVGLRAAETTGVALVNTDIVLDQDWLERLSGILAADPGLASVACKMVDLAEPTILYDAGDVLRRDGVCVQRGRRRPDDGRYDMPGDVFAACAGAALYRREAVLAVGAFDERFFSYLEDADLGLRLRLAGWRCSYEPAVARHAGGGSSWQLERSVPAWAQRNTVLLMARAFPWRWAPSVAYRQLGWAWHALRERRLRAHLAGTAAALPLLPAMLRERRSLRRDARVPIDVVIPRQPIRGPLAAP